MIITCPCGKKKFEVDASLIPVDGKMLQCGSCNQKWFYKKPKEKNIEKPISPVEEFLSKNKNDEIPIETEIIIDEAEKNNISETAKSSYNKKISFFNIFLILIISFIALIIVLDTFKTPINNFLPGFIFFLENFYLALDDLLLFLTDLIRQ